MVELALSGIAAHSVRPLRFAIWLALGFALLSLLFIVYAVVSFLFVQHTVAGWSSLVAVIAILGAAQLLVLGIIGEYVGRILRETRKRPSYIVAETESAKGERHDNLVSLDYFGRGSLRLAPAAISRPSRFAVTASISVSATLRTSS